MSLSKLSVSVLAIGLSLISTSVMGQESETYMNVGETSQGDHIFLNTKEIISTSFNLYTMSDNTLFKMEYQADCGDDTLSLIKASSYGDNGVKTGERIMGKDVPFDSKTPPGKAMVYVCRRIGARGW